jgi:hypothetical protein
VEFQKLHFFDAEGRVALCQVCIVLFVADAASEHRDFALPVSVVAELPIVPYQ